jgi:hypothetical protein
MEQEQGPAYSVNPSPRSFSAGNNFKDSNDLPDSAIGSARAAAPELPGAVTPSNPIEKALTHIRQWLPYAQKVLMPLLDGNLSTAVGNLMNPPKVQLPTSVRINIDGLERNVAEVAAGHRELRGQMMDQAVQLKRVEDQLEHVREATDRNTLEQQELIEDLRTANSRIRGIVAVAVFLLLGVGVVQLYILYQLAQLPR